MKKFLSIILVLFLLVTSYVTAQEPSVSVGLDTTRIRIGEQVVYTIKVNYANEITFPEEISGIDNGEQVAVKVADTLQDKSIIKEYILTSFDSGTVKIPRQELFIGGRSIRTDSLKIEIQSIVVDTLKQNLFPIKSIIQEPVTWKDYISYIWILIVVLLLIVALLLFIFIKNKKAQEDEMRPKLSPIESAMQAFEDLDKKQLWQNNKVKAYYIALTDILRNYAEEKFDIPAKESTTDELLLLLETLRQQDKIVYTDAVYTALKPLLKEADLVKFAKLKPLEDTIRQHRKEAEEIIKDLKEKEIDTVNEQMKDVEESIGNNNTKPSH